MYFYMFIDVRYRDIHEYSNRTYNSYQPKHRKLSIVTTEGRSSKEIETRKLAVHLVKRVDQKMTWNDELVKKHARILSSFAMEIKTFITLEQNSQLVSTESIHLNDLRNNNRGRAVV